MSRTLRVASAALTLAALPALSACGSGFNASTNKVQADNAAGEAGDVLARAIVLVKSRNALPAALAGTLINRGDRPEVLERIELTESTPGARTITIEPGITLRPGVPLALGTEGVDPITVAEAGGLRVGNFALVVLSFRTAGDISLQVPIETRSGFYSDIVPSAPPRFDITLNDGDEDEPESEGGSEAGDQDVDGDADRADRRARKADRKP